jgi:hypothetical protein
MAEAVANGVEVHDELKRRRASYPVVDGCGRPLASVLRDSTRERR